MTDDKHELTLRHTQKFQLIQNPNYFGNLTALLYTGRTYTTY